MCRLHIVVTLSIAESDASSGIIMSSLVFWSASMVVIVINSRTKENAFSLSSSESIIFTLPQSYSVKRRIGDAQFCMNRQYRLSRPLNTRNCLFASE